MNLSRTIQSLVLVACMVMAASECPGATSRKPASKSRASSSSRARIPPTARDPYSGAIVVDASTGKTMFEENSDTPCYPASVVKLMDILIIQEMLEAGALSLSNRVMVTREAATTGGSQVYLKEGESFTLEDMLYALMVKSANDAAVALAIHVAGTKDGFINLMNKRAAELGMTSSKFSSVHGLPPSEGQDPDITTPRDMSRLCREILKHPEILKYTSCDMRMFGEGVRPTSTQIEMRNHNRLLGVVEGCDGFKTGWIRASGYSIAATAARNGRRVIVVVMGSLERPKRDDIAKQLIASAFLKLSAVARPAVNTNKVQQVQSMPDEREPDEEGESGHSGWFIAGVVIGVLAISSVLAYVLARRLGQA